MLFCIAAAERGVLVLCGWGAQRVSWCEFPLGPSGVGVCTPQTAGPAGHRTCSTGLLSYSEPGPGRSPLRGGFSPLPPTDSHWVAGIPSIFSDKVKGWTLLPPPIQYWWWWFIMNWMQEAGLWKCPSHLTVCPSHELLPFEADQECGEVSLHTSLIHFCLLNWVHFNKQFKVTYQILVGLMAWY